MRKLFLSLLLMASNSLVLAQPQVVASIRPLQLIAQAVTQGVSVPGLVLDGTQDPHHPALRPSQRLLMDQADIFLWVGPQMETGFERIIEELDAEAMAVQFMPGFTMLTLGDQVDPHFWLDTRNAAVIAKLLATSLFIHDPDNAEVYQNNLAIFQDELVRLEQEIKRIIDATSFPPFAVYHNGYQYFEKQFGLSHQASFTGNEEILPGIRKVLEVKAILEASQVQCIVVDPTVNTAFLDSQLDIDTLHYASVDVIAQGGDSQEPSYVNFMRQFTAAFNACRQ